MSFSQLAVSTPIQRALNDLGYTNPTPIQSKSIPIVNQRKDLLACAQTGTGKTAGFAIPVLQLMEEDKNTRQATKGIQALVLTPTRELAIQVEESFRDYGKYLPFRSLAIFGGVSQVPQVQQLQKGIDILIATPGRLLDLIGQGLLSINSIRYFVLDEADRMLDMGFVHDVKKVLQYIPAKRQSLFFSATMPAEIRQLAARILVNPETVAVTPVSSTTELVKQEVRFMEKEEKRDGLVGLIRELSIRSVLVFTRTKYGADKLSRFLQKAGISSAAIHGDKTQGARQRALADFKEGKIVALVATDIAARGIDIDELAFVVNYELPNVPETYVHRIGRTGRAGNNGSAFSFCDREERQYLKDIEKLIGMKIPVARMAMPV
ncbi:DEAD/DEAH box helicase [Flavihumibacter sp. CACIAM 22H1]|uniref:DEAD/DEAH box helicase n=1 Tax=Flavihumibacter sp. CACIAM 22H1 TaxID=1812911 RepID=UPI0007A81D2A|nr:DEAD/DEAH box helicase [Flavihumibacter sp. CACIAM 22H1]KYP12928.1 MAG: DEAD/DEAH box helicase [Flavihumibacter sp. CACIAM 22H1]